MKNKKMTYLLGLVVVILWGMIIYRVLESFGGSDNDMAPLASVSIKNEPFDDYAIQKDTARLSLNYRDPFDLTPFNDTIKKVKKVHLQAVNATVIHPPVNWSFIQYSGYVSNPKSKKLITLININGQNEVFKENEQKDQVKLIRNFRDSIKISYNGKIKFIHLKSATQ